MKQHGLNLKAAGHTICRACMISWGAVRDNNNREWFKANKAEYDELRALWLADIDVMLAHMSEWWPSLRSVTAKGCAYRIYRDTRFSLDKTPLKTYFRPVRGLTGAPAMIRGSTYSWDRRVALTGTKAASTAVCGVPMPRR